MFTEIQHKALIEQCKDWYNVLGAYKAKLDEMKDYLYWFSKDKNQQETQMGIEHFQNQFHIQLINLHDVKHELRDQIQLAELHPLYRFKEPYYEVKAKIDRLVNDINELEKSFNKFTAHLV